MAKAWDCIREAPMPGPIRSGQWCTTHEGVIPAVVEVDVKGKTTAVLKFSDYGAIGFYPDELRQIAEFCNELADQLES